MPSDIPSVVRTLARHLDGVKVDARVDTGVTMATPENMEQPEIKELLNPDPPGKMYATADTYLNRGSWEKAAKKFEDLDRDHPYAPEARRAMVMAAYAYFRAGKFPEAIATARRLGADVHAYDVRPETREQIESLGAKHTNKPVEEIVVDEDSAAEDRIVADRTRIPYPFGNGGELLALSERVLARPPPPIGAGGGDLERRVCAAGESHQHGAAQRDELISAFRELLVSTYAKSLAKSPQRDIVGEGTESVHPISLLRKAYGI